VNFYAVDVRSHEYRFGAKKKIGIERALWNVTIAGLPIPERKGADITFPPLGEWRRSPPLRVYDATAAIHKFLCN
jgi:hypothetical protein